MVMLDRSTATATPAPVPCPGLPGPPTEWPRAASAAYWSLLRDLNHWCRDTGSPMATNAWVAETAVREAWASAG